ncbi:MAG: hypothetical protein V4697_03965 [Patescibacteria group bacterium]
MDQGDKSRIDELKKSLYSRSTPDVRTKRRLHWTKDDTDVKTDWEHEEEPREPVVLNKYYNDNSMSFFTKLLVGSIIFFVFAVGIGALLLFKGSNLVSANNIDISINGPVSVAGGEPVAFDVQVLNKNNIKLETVDLAVEFPAGTTDVVDTTKELKTLRELIPDIEPGGTGTKNIQAIVYGEENSKKIIKVSVEYRVKGSNAVFQKEKTFEVLISSSPITLSIESISEITSNQQFEMTVVMTSNSQEVIKNLLLKAVYPFGFNFVSSNIKPLSDNSTWRIGDIPPGGKKTITITGNLEGQDDEIRAFRFVTGAQSTKNDKVIGTEYVAISQEIGIKKPFITVNISLDDDASGRDYIGAFNAPIKVDVAWFNNLDTPILNGEIVAQLSGNAFDKSSVNPEQGLYKSAQNQIVWNSITTPSLGDIPAGGEGRVSFTITPKNLGTEAKPITNPNLSVEVSVKGNRTSENNVPEAISSSAKRSVRVASNIALGGRVVRSTGPFPNLAPVPPKAEKETTYTVIWTIDNTSSAATGAEVRASLPAHVKWMGKIDPANESLTYNAVDGQLVWKIGSVDTYSSSANRKQVAFQVGLTPSVSQIGQVPVLVNSAVLTAQDSFTGKALQSTLGSLTTRFSTDSTFKDGDERVAQ